MNDSNFDGKLPPGSSKFDPEHGPSTSRSDHKSDFRLPLWLKISILAAVVAMAAAGYVASQMKTREILQQHSKIEPADASEIAQRKQIQDFILTDVSGAKKKLSDFRGNVVILSFWASWCGPCLAELPTFAEIERKYHDKGLRVIPVNVDDDDAGKVFAKEFWPKKKIDFPSYYDTTKDLANQFEVDILPSSFVIDREGRLVFSSAGASDWSSTDTQNLVEAVLNEPHP
jgi:thiol-disulfide isomerase/thioredoxin